MARGSATVAVPLSLDIQAEQREEGRLGGKRKRRRKRSWRKVRQAKQRERTEEAYGAIAHVLLGLVLAQSDLESSKCFEVESDEKEENLPKMSFTGLQGTDDGQTSFL